MTNKKKLKKKNSQQFEIKKGQRNIELIMDDGDKRKPGLLELPEDVMEVLRVEEGYLIKIELKENGEVLIDKRAGKQQDIFSGNQDESS
ncbi:MAG: hypothetical protein OEY59_06170 [Deltaproteobacteria bacterium]|nr:hypothetical protein [Deltaproteobacteria bacterium]